MFKNLLSPFNWAANLISAILVLVGAFSLESAVRDYARSWGLGFLVGAPKWFTVSILWLILAFLLLIVQYLRAWRQTKPRFRLEFNDRCVSPLIPTASESGAYVPSSSSTVSFQATSTITEVFRTFGGTQVNRGRWVGIDVHNFRRGHAKNARAQLLSISYRKSDLDDFLEIYSTPVTVPWSPAHQHEINPIDIPGYSRHRFDVFMITGTNVIIPILRPYPSQLSSLITEIGTYRFHIRIWADECPKLEADFDFYWHGDVNQIQTGNFKLSVLLNFSG